MDSEIGIAGWLFSREILRDKSMTLLDMPSTCTSYGVKVVELCSKFFPSQETDYLNELRMALEEDNLSVHNIAVDMGNIAGMNRKKRRTDIEGLKQWFYTASAVGSKAIRINTGHADDPEAMKRVIDAYRELTVVGKQAGVKLLIENHGGMSAYSNDLAQILEGVDSDWFGTCPDTGNFMPNDWEAGMRVLAPRAFSCHVKLFSLSEDGWQSWTDRNGVERKFTVKKSLQILKDSGYEG